MFALIRGVKVNGAVIQRLMDEFQVFFSLSLARSGCFIFVVACSRCLPFSCRIIDIVAVTPGDHAEYRLIHSVVLLTYSLIQGLLRPK